MFRFAMASLLTLALAGSEPAFAQAPNWVLAKVERSDQGIVSETKINPISGLTETKSQMVFGKKNEFLKLSISFRPDKNGRVPSTLDFKLVDSGDAKRAFKKTYFFRKDNVIIIYFQGDFTNLDGLTLVGPGGRNQPLGKNKK